MALIPTGGTFFDSTLPSVPFYDVDNILPIFCNNNESNRFENWVRLEDLNRCMSKNSKEVIHFLYNTNNVKFNYGHIFSSSHCVYFNLNRRVHEGFSLVPDTNTTSATISTYNNNTYIPTFNDQSQTTRVQQREPIPPISTHQTPLPSYVSNNIYNFNVDRCTQNSLPHHQLHRHHNYQQRPNTNNKCSVYYNAETDRSYNNNTANASSSATDPTSFVRSGFNAYMGNTAMAPATLYKNGHIYSHPTPTPSSLPMTISPSSSSSDSSNNNSRYQRKEDTIAKSLYKSRRLVLSFCSYTKDNRFFIKVIRAQSKQTKRFHNIIKRSKKENFKLPAYLISSQWLKCDAKKLFSMDCEDARQRWDDFFTAHPREFFSTASIKAANNTTLMLLNRQEISDKYRQPRSNFLFRKTLGSERDIQERAFLTVENFSNFIKYHLGGQSSKK